MLTEQEHKVAEFLSTRQNAYWEELLQFCKSPTTTKLGTLKHIVSDIKKKFREAGMDCPFSTTLSLMTPAEENPASSEAIVVNGQTLVKVPKPQPVVDNAKACQKDFIIDKYNKRIRSKEGVRVLNDDDFEVFEYLWQHPETVVSLEELRDKVVYPQFGSKLPPRWFYAIQRRVNNLRRTIPELKDRLLTVKLNNGSGYLLK